MNPKSLGIAAASALALVALGLSIQKLSRPPEAAAHTGDRLFPELLDSINDVGSLTVTTAAGEYRILRQDGRWGLAEKGGYPVDAGQVSKALIAMAELEQLEPKTSDPSRYPDIGVQDAQAEGSSSKLVTLRDGKDVELAALIVGERRSGRGETSYYVRKPGDAQSWLVQGDLDLEDGGTDWLDKKILEVKRAEVRAVETTQADGQVLLVSKGAPEDTGFEVHDIPPDRELKYATVANGMGSALEYLNLEDVLPASEFEAPEGGAVRTSYWTFDGMRIDVALYDKDAKAYAILRASYDSAGPPALAVVGPPPPPEGEPAAEEAATEGAPPADAITGEEPAAKRPAEEVQAEASKLAERLSPWVFEIPAYNKTNFTKRMEDMLKELEPPPVDEQGGADALPGEAGGGEASVEDGDAGLEDPSGQPEEGSSTEEPPGDAPGAGGEAEEGDAPTEESEDPAQKPPAESGGAAGSEGGGGR